MLNIFYLVIIKPLEITFEIIYAVMERLLHSQGFAVVAVSIAMSLLTLPLYRRADKMQEDEHQKQKSMQKWVSHIKNTFKGDERFLLTQEYYRQNDYSPLNALKGSFSLLLEIPFFIAAYHFLSHLKALQGSGFYIIKDLGKPDALLNIWGGVAINILPILMTAINCISGAIYTKGFPIKDKVQLYGMALIFLLLLYSSPSGLVIYWTMNNVFSLVKNIFYKLKSPQKVILVLCTALGFIIPIALIYMGRAGTKRKFIFTLILSFLCFVPLIITLIKKITLSLKILPAQEEKPQRSSLALFVLTSLVLSILLGILIPLSVISASPAEFLNVQKLCSPIVHIKEPLCIFAGICIFWFSVIYFIIPQKNKSAFAHFASIISIIAIVDYMFFGKGLGTLSNALFFDVPPTYTLSQKIINIVILSAIISTFIFLFKKLETKHIAIFEGLLLFSISVLSAKDIALINKSYKEIKAHTGNEIAEMQKRKVLNFSTQGQNVVVIMLDRAIGGYVPLIMEELPSLKEQFAGFTYYPNTLSHGFYTNFGTPGLFGGYEYTPTEMNKRDKETLVSKQNEALKVLPVLFSNNGFAVTVCDPPYANYQWIPDLSIYKNLEGITALNLKASFLKRDSDADEDRNFFFYSLFKTAPLFFQTTIYDDGSYFSDSNVEMLYGFMSSFSTLEALSDLTVINDASQSNFIMMNNEATHDPVEMQLPDYEVSFNIDNSAYTIKASDKIDLSNYSQLIHYQTNAAVFRQLAQWFDYLKKEGVWDNTKIILVSDHGRGLGQFDYMFMDNINLDVQWCNPLLMVKDFNAHEFTTDNTFMTNADVPTLATNGVIEEPINPFTNKPINSLPKIERPQIVTSSANFLTDDKKRTTFDTSDGHWYSVHDNIFEQENWSLIE